MSYCSDEVDITGLSLPELNSTTFEDGDLTSKCRTINMRFSTIDSDPFHSADASMSDSDNVSTDNESESEHEFSR